MLGLNRLGLLMLALCASVVVWVLYTAADQPVSNVVVEGGLNPVERQQVERALELARGEGLLSMNLPQARERLLDLGWPASVSVRRVWPNTLVVQITKQRAVARWRDGELVMSTGNLVRGMVARPTLPMLFSSQRGPADVLEVFSRLNAIGEQFDKPIVELTEDSLGSWTVDFLGGLQLMLGHRELEVRLQNFLRALPDLEARFGTLAYADARYTNGFAVKSQGSLLAARGDGGTEDAMAVETLDRLSELNTAHSTPANVVEQREMVSN